MTMGAGPGEPSVSQPQQATEAPEPLSPIPFGQTVQVPLRSYFATKEDLQILQTELQKEIGKSQMRIMTFGASAFAAVILALIGLIATIFVRGG